MAETYCGKSCESCEHKEAMHCPGCRLGPGRTGTNNCELAACCRGKGHESCETCIFRGNCATLRNCGTMPDRRRRSQEEDAERNAAIARNAPLMGKWVWCVFWLLVPNSVGALLVTLGEGTPLYWLGKALQLGCAVAYCVMLLNLTPVSPRFKTAAVCALIANVGNSMVDIFLSVPSRMGLQLLFLLPLLPLSLVAEYNEYNGYAHTLESCQPERAQKWRNLWHLTVAYLCVMGGSILLIFLSPILGALLLLGGTIFALVVGILKYVYLYRTAKFYRNFTAGQPGIPERC